MPIYEYGCGECGHIFEEMILSGDTEPTECPACGNEEIGRLVSNTAFQLKGSGWYVTDYKDGGSKSSSSKSSESSGTESTDTSESSGGSDSTSSESTSTSSSNTDDVA